jgi:hypothetical protein
MNVSFTIPGPVAQELNQIASENGFANAKEMTIAYWRHTIRASRANKAMEGIREAAELQADRDTETIS